MFQLFIGKKKKVMRFSFKNGAQRFTNNFIFKVQCTMNHKLKFNVSKRL